MGKCSGLKGGGHHRRAMDVAAKKQSEKAARKKEQAEAGKRAVILKEILTTIDIDCELYLDAALCDGANHSSPKKKGQENEALPELCRKHFRFEACSNKRCRFSKEFSIVEALSNVTSGTNSNDFDDESGHPTIPALRYLPGILEDTNTRSKKKKNHSILRRRRERTFRVEDGEASDNFAGDGNHQGPLSAFEMALSEGSSAVDRIVSCLDSDRDVVSFASTCWQLYEQILKDDGCPDVQLRKYRAKHRKLERRNTMLLSNKALGGSLRYAVGYFPSHYKTSSSKKNKKANNNKNGNKSNLRPVLIFDFENPNVYKAFQQSGVRKTYTTNFNFNSSSSSNKSGKVGLESPLANDCTISE